MLLVILILCIFHENQVGFIFACLSMLHYIARNFMSAFLESKKELTRKTQKKDNTISKKA